STESSVQPLDEFLYNTPRITLQGLKDATNESSHVVVATVKRTLNPDSYWYTSCLCGKAVVPDSQMWYCEKCNGHVSKVVP
ncbi:replication factor A protein, partial [Trifolium pratense]